MTDDTDALLAHAGTLDEEPRFYEPWTPVVGQRVRVRLSGECNFLGESGSHGHQRGRAHPEWMDGLVGTVVSIGDLRTFVRMGHPYQVEWDTPQIEDGATFSAADYAAIELEPLAPDDPARAEGEA